MIQPPFTDVSLDASRLQHLLDLRSQFGRAGSRILGIKQRLWETTKVMDGFRFFHRSNGGATGIPVSGYGNDALRTWQGFTQRTPCPGVAVFFQRVHRATVAEEKCWHTRGFHRGSLVGRNTFYEPDYAVCRGKTAG
ncbi:hypothetical protein D3C78_1129190 [compost metagenome]